MNKIVDNEETRAEQEDENDFGNVLEPCIVAMDYKERRLGCAFYRLHEKKLFLVADTEDSVPFEYMKSLRFQIEPDVLITTSRAQDAFLDHDKCATNIRQEIRPSSEFSSASALRKLSTVFRPEEIELALNTGIGQQELQQKRSHQLLGRLDGRSTIGLACINSLLSYIERRRDTGNIFGDEYLVQMIVSMEMFFTHSVMMLTADTVQALEIFANEMKLPSHLKQQDRPLDLFKILNLCRTVGGKRLMRQWFLRPSLDLALLQDRHDTIECLLSTSNFEARKSICQTLRQLPCMQRTLNQLSQGKQGTGCRSEWHAIIAFTLNALKMKQLIMDLVDHQISITLQRIPQVFNSDKLQLIASMVGDVVDFDESKIEKRIVVKRCVDEQLDGHKHMYDGLDHMLTKVCLEISQDVPSQFADMVQCIYMPQLGFLVVMPTQSIEVDSTVQAIWSHSSWQELFSTESSVYFKTTKMNELDEYFGDIHSLIVDREIDVLYQLQMRVLRHSEDLQAYSDLISELDCLVSFAEVAAKNNYAKPTMTDDNELEIIKGRHPIQEVTVSPFIENDTILQGRDAPMDQINRRTETPQEIDLPNLILLTGANYSGKSIYLKQAALIVYMAHIGSYVPATAAKIGITDCILTRVQTIESISKDMSVFMIELQQVNIALNLMTPRSLLIIDEFGRGTEQTDGASLFAALVEFLTDTRRIRPRVLVATHFHEVLTPGILKITPAISLKHMEIILDDTAEDLASQVTYLYRLANGPSRASFGLHCAAKAGIPAKVLARAEQFLEITSKGESLVQALAVLSDKDREDLKHAERVVRKLVAWDIEAEPDDKLYSKLAEIVR